MEFFETTVKTIVTLPAIIFDLGKHYLADATPFFILHFLLLLYFLIKWSRSWKFLKSDLAELQSTSDTAPTLFAGVEEDIQGHDGIGRVYFIRDLEESILEKVHRNTEPLRLLGSSFIAVGLLGTLFALFQVGSQINQPPVGPSNSQTVVQTNQKSDTALTTQSPPSLANQQMQIQVDKNKELVNRMSIAFSSSFFGLLLSLFCSIVLLKPLRVRVSRVSSEVRKRIADLSKRYPVNTPDRSLTEAVNEMKKYAKGFDDVIGRMEKASNAHNETSIQLFENFTETTQSMVGDLTKSISNAQDEMKASAENLATKVSNTLDELKDSFSDISDNLKEELQTTIKSSETAATRLSDSSIELTKTTVKVSDSLEAVSKALEHTKYLSEVAKEVKLSTDEYLRQTREQVDLFKSSLEGTVEQNQTILGEIGESSKQNANEWFTMLEDRNTELTTKFDLITSSWESEVRGISTSFFSEFERIDSTLVKVSEILRPDGTFADGVVELQRIIDNSRIALEDSQKALAAAEENAEGREEIMRLSGAVDGLINAVMSFPTTVRAVSDNDGRFQALEKQARETHALLKNFVEKPAVPEKIPAPAAPDPPKAGGRKSATLKKGAGGDTRTGEATKQPGPSTKPTQTAEPAAPESPVDQDIPAVLEAPTTTLPPATTEEPSGETPADSLDAQSENGQAPSGETEGGNGAQPRKVGYPDIDSQQGEKSKLHVFNPESAAKTGFFQKVKNTWGRIFNSEEETTVSDEETTVSDETKPE